MINKIIRLVKIRKTKLQVYKEDMGRALFLRVYLCFLRFSFLLMSLQSEVSSTVFCSLILSSRKQKVNNQVAFHFLLLVCKNILFAFRLRFNEVALHLVVKDPTYLSKFMKCFGIE